MGEPESLNTDEPLARRVVRHDYDRLIMLSDGVFAISMTLLALDVKPGGRLSETASTAQVWAAASPSVLAFVLSFAVISVFWATHKRLFARLKRADAWLSAFCVLELAEIALIPPTTKLLYEHGLLAGRPLYLGLIGLLGLTQAAAWAYAAYFAGLIHEEVGRRARLVAVASNIVTPVIMSATALYAFDGRPAWMSLAMIAGAASLLLLRRWALKGGKARPPPSSAPAARS